MTNPYADDPYHSAWQQGHDYGQQNPGETQPQHPDFSSWGYDADVTNYVAQVWGEGALAGRESNAASTGGGGGPDAGAPAPAAGGGADALDGGLPGGVATPAAPPAAVDLSHARVHTVKFWLNAFIEPAHVDGPPGYGLAYNYEYFSGDSRGYSSDIHASSRMHSEVEITGVNTEEPQISFQWHNCGESHALDSSLNIVDTKTATPRAEFGAPSHSNGTVSIGYTGAANMPLITGSPDIDAHGTFSVDASTGEVTFSGMIDAFPWFEAYATVNNGAPVMLINEDPTGSGPMDLLGDANRGVHGSANALGE